MRIRAVSLALLTLLLGLAALTLAACGDDNGGDAASEVEEGAEEAGSEAEEGAEEAGSAAEEGAEEAGSAAEEAGSEAKEGANEAAPSGDAVRSEKVEIVDFSYDPDPVTIEEGGKVTWINQDSAPHTATADDGSFDTGTLEEGKLKSETFKEPGEYTYFCTIHPSMKGTIKVVGSD